jgi:hypothetical protein
VRWDTLVIEKVCRDIGHAFSTQFSTRVVIVAMRKWRHSRGRQ